jgi:uncharacterized protein
VSCATLKWRGTGVGRKADMYDTCGLEILDVGECHRLLRQARVGRFVFIDRTRLAAHPVEFIFDAGSVVSRTNHGVKYRAASQHHIVGFEVDDIDLDAGTAWSVVLTGHAEPVVDPFELARLAPVLPAPWLCADGSEVVRVHAEIVEGRRQTDLRRVQRLPDVQLPLDSDHPRIKRSLADGFDPRKPR